MCTSDVLRLESTVHNSLGVRTSSKFDAINPGSMFLQSFEPPPTQDI